MTSSTATLIGLTAIVMWSLLAVLTVATGRVPPFQLLAMTFAVGACIGPLTWPWRRGALRAWRQPALVWLVGVGGLFGYHALYFLALRLAPPEPRHDPAGRQAGGAQAHSGGFCSAGLRTPIQGRLR